ncbi:Copper amine oxidase N-terminal domain-containing protein [Paenibacillus sophorae]|uniref:Copper amine oxidase N-terminal domain-containing protein n=1 Tax=Paenibacillus sophorae TaxID=1333845 RepID=A0A1H8U7L2_9BACL|nr:copper amine oxidase N-terminal domain-containing protein [Paenibacillus sophorae]QWU17982.1 copper amine oxidase N-terminal domain-containing protein [Paenibacillus sophorae]SEO99047.1 Copper amine oxidase N-terminal domain-containing protein [Paenibacillus sophorae]
MKKWLAGLGLVLGITLSVQGAALAEETGTSIAEFGPSSLIKSDGSYWIWGVNQSVPTPLVGLGKIKADLGNGVVQKQDGSVWLVSRNDRTYAIEIRKVEGLNHPVKVLHSTPYEAVAVDADGSIYRSAKDGNGYADLTSFSPVSGISQVTDADGYYEQARRESKWHYTFLKSDGTVWRANKDLSSFEQIPNLSGVTNIEGFTALKQDGTVWTWPTEFDSDQLPVNPPIAEAIPGLADIRSVELSRRANLAIDGSSRLWFWGSTITGVSDGTTLHEHDKPILLTGISDVKEAFSVETSLMVLTASGKVCAASIYRESMPANAEFALITSDVKTMRNGGRHLIMQKTDGSLWGWGVNKNAQQGTGDYEFMHREPVEMQKPISVTLNGEAVSMNSGGVITKDGQNFVPLRSVFEKLGAVVAYEETSGQKMVTITRQDGDKKTVIQVNAKTGATYVNGTQIKLANNPFNVSGTVYLPLRFISEKLGAAVEWLPGEERIAITMK